MTSQELAQALRELDRLYEQSALFRAWLTGQQQSQGDYAQAIARLEAANPGLVVKRVNLTYRVGHVLAPEE